MTPELSNAINVIYDVMPPWEATARENRLLELAKRGSEGAMCDLIASLGMTSDERFAEFYASIRCGEDVDPNINDILARNNLTPAMLAAAAGVSERTVANWRHYLPADAAARFAEIEAAKCAAGEWPIPGEPQAVKLLERRRRLAAAARKKLTPEARRRAGQNAAAARIANREKSELSRDD